jgi:hypothetical protein
MKEKTPSSSQPRPFLRTAWVPALLVLLALGARLLPGARTIDDSYITFRYARNILQGNGFVYNPGERVLGTTTPLYTLVMTGLAVLTGGADAPFPWLSLGLNAAADALTCLLLWRLGRHLRLPYAGFFAAAAWALAPFSVTFAIGGLETSLYVLLLTGTATAYLEKRSTTAGLLAALAVLTRPDALILVGPLMLDRLWRALRRRERLQAGELIAFFLPALAWLAFAALYFGSPIPHSITAKTAAYQLPPTAGLVRLLQHYATLFHQHYFLGGVGIAIGLVLFTFLEITGAVYIWKQAPRLRVWLLYPLLYFVIFAAANPLIFRWYLTPPLPGLFLLVFAGAERLLNNPLHLNNRPRHGWRRALALVLLSLPLLSLINAWTLHPDHGPDRPAPQMAYIQLELLYRQAADLVTPQLQPGDVLAAGDVGVLGYRTGAVILDTVGLNSPQTLQYYPLPPDAYVINYAISSDLILDEQPDWLVILEVYGRNTLLQDERFLQAYTLENTIPTDIYGSEGMLIFRRNNS